MSEEKSKPSIWEDNAFGVMRLLLAAMVLLGHAPGLSREPGAWIYGIFQDFGYGSTAVMGFMCISGVLITRSFERSSTWKRYLQRRLLRIFPGFWVCLVMCALVFAPLAWWLMHKSMAGFPWSGKDNAISFIYMNVTTKLEQPYITGLYHGEGVNFPMWTIISELFCYIFTLVVGVLGLGRKFRWIYPVLAAVVLGYVSYKAGSDIRAFVDTRLIHFGTYLVGASLYYFHDEFRIDHLKAGIALVVLWFSSQNPALYALFPVAFSVLVLWLAFHLPIKNIEKHGDISYGVYLYGWPCQLLVTELGGAKYGMAVYVLLTLLMLLPMAWLSYRFVERPFMGSRKPKPGSDAPGSPGAAAQAH